MKLSQFKKFQKQDQELGSEIKDVFSMKDYRGIMKLMEKAKVEKY